MENKRLSQSNKCHFFKVLSMQMCCYRCQHTSPLLLKPRISWLMLDVRPDWISCRWRNRLSLARPRPLSNWPCVRTPRTVLLPASTFPSTARRMSINCRKQTITTTTKKGKGKHTCIAPLMILHLKALGYGSHRIAPANYTTPASTLRAFARCRHLIQLATHLSTPEGWKAELA